MLLPLFTRPDEDPASWYAASQVGAGAMVMLRLADPASRPPPVGIIEAIRCLGEAGTRLVGHVSLGYGARHPSEVSAELCQWSTLGVDGVFFDHAPTGQLPFDQVARTVRVAHHSGLRDIVVNAGGPVHPIYRNLDATICTFEGSWTDYLTWSGEEAEEGDGHLVFGVPKQARAVALALVAARGAGLYLISEWTNAYSAATVELDAITLT
jgi:hypothetical protein